MSGRGAARWWPAYVGLGSNLDHPEAQVRRAYSALAALPGTCCHRLSRRYRSAPMGPVAQPDFVNACAGMLTTLEPEALLSELQRIERDHGRRRDGERWGPRTLDLDLLVCGKRTLASDALTLPHPGIAERNFVLLPLAEIAPGLSIPGVGHVAVLSAAIDRQGIRIMRDDV